MLLTRAEEASLLGIQIRLQSAQDHLQVGGSSADKVAA